MFFVRRLSPLAREGFGDRLPVGQGVVDVLLFRFSLFLRALPVCLDSPTLRTAGFVFLRSFRPTPMAVEYLYPCFCSLRVDWTTWTDYMDYMDWTTWTDYMD